MAGLSREKPPGLVARQRSLARSAEAATPALAFRPRRHGEHAGARSSLVMHNIVVAGRRTSIRIEPAIWEALKSIARQQGVSVHELVSDIDRARPASSLSSAIRAFVVVQLSAGLRVAQEAARARDD